MHFATYSLVGESVEQPLLYFRNNLARTVELLAAFARVYTAIDTAECDNKNCVGHQQKRPRNQLRCHAALAAASAHLES